MWYSYETYSDSLACSKTSPDSLFYHRRIRSELADETSANRNSTTFFVSAPLPTVINTTLSVAYSVGTLVGKMHAAGVIHGDLTTSNWLQTLLQKEVAAKKRTSMEPKLGSHLFRVSNHSTNANIIITTNNTAGPQQISMV